MNFIDRFVSTYDRDPDGIAFCPYRVCPIGAHVDHNLGRVTGFAIDKGVSIAFSAKQNGVIELKSMQFEKRAQWHVMSTPLMKQGDWADYLRGATIALGKKHVLKVGLCGVINGSLPIGGLSSSAAVTIAFIKALCAVNGISLGKEEIIGTALMAENKYVGVSCGKLDQSCEVLSKKDCLLYLDTMDDSYELIKTPSNMKKFRIAVVFSGVQRSLAGTKFNMRVDEAKSAAYALKAFAGMEYGKFEQTFLRDVPYEVYLKYRERLPKNWGMRAEHWYTEQERVSKGVELYRKGDLEGYGKLCFESGYSSIYNWETGSQELIRLYEIMRDTDGIYGGRFSGAGFKGCCMALIDPGFEESIRVRLEREYLKSFPALRDKYLFTVCDSADGVLG